MSKMLTMEQVNALRNVILCDVHEQTWLDITGTLEAALKVVEAVKAELCPECRVKSLAEYQDKYGIVKNEWSLEQALEAMRSIHYDRMELLRQIQEAREAAIEDAAQAVNSYMYEKGLSVELIDLAEQIRALKRPREDKP